MATTLNSKIILCKDIKIDKNYLNILNYSSTEMLSLCNSQAHKVASSNTYSFIRQNKNQLIVDFNYSTCLQANYMAFQNPDYSNKWFFAFIDDVIYTSDSATTIVYTIDVWSTWYDNWSAKPCFVEREHTNNDTIGANTLPEGLEHGEYVMASNFQKTNLISNYAICIEATAGYESGGTIINIGGGSMINRVFSGVNQYYFKDSVGTSGAKAWACAQRFLRKFDEGGKGESIVGIYMVPESFTDNATWRPIEAGGDLYYGVIQESFLYENPFPMGTFASITTPSTLAGGYVPKNNKLYTFPYRYCLVSNNAGVEIPFHYENFSSSNIAFDIYGSITPGCDIKMIPLNYKGIQENIDEAISLAKLPVCSWASDMYTNWLTQTSLNRTFGEIESGVKLISGGAQLIAGSPTGLADVSAGINGIKNMMVEKYEHSFLPSQAKGNINSGNINFALDYIDFSFYHYSIKPEYARCIDDFFTRFGYQTNRLKVPNITGRRYWNYVKIASGEDIGNGSIPSNYMEQINNIFRTGTTIWHDHDNIDNYSLNNSII